MKVVLVTSLKNEGPYVLEWVAYHKAIGFNDIFIFENDSDDYTDLILTRLQDLGEITFIKNQDFTGSPQFYSYKIFRSMEAYQSADWVMCIDGDEFFVPKTKDNVTDFLSGYTSSDAIAINWLNFGSGDQARWQDAPVLDRFSRCAPAVHGTNRYFKSFHRPNEKFKSFGIHRPWPREPIDSFIYSNFKQVEPETQKGGHPPLSDDLPERQAIACLNHYSIKSLEEFERKKIRGRGAKPDQAYGAQDKFNKYDTNTESNHDIARFIPAMRAWLDHYRSDAVLNFLHKQACLRHFPSA